MRTLPLTCYPVVSCTIMRWTIASSVLFSLLTLATATPEDDLTAWQELLPQIVLTESQWQSGNLNTSYVLAGDSTTANG